MSLKDNPSAAATPASAKKPSVPGKRVGLIVPSTNTVMEPDLYRHLPEGVTVHTSRMLLEGSVTIEAEEKMLDVYLPEKKGKNKGRSRGKVASAP